MTHSVDAEDRATHLKIVVASVLCAIVFALVGLMARVGEMNGTQATSRIEAKGPVISAGTMNVVTSNERNTIH